MRRASTSSNTIDSQDSDGQSSTWHSQRDEDFEDLRDAEEQIHPAKDPELTGRQLNELEKTWKAGGSLQQTPCSCDMLKLSTLSGQYSSLSQAQVLQQFIFTEASFDHLPDVALLSTPVAQNAADPFFTAKRRASPYDVGFSGASRSCFPDAYTQVGEADFSAMSFTTPFSQQSTFERDLQDPISMARRFCLGVNNTDTPFNLSPAPTTLPASAFETFVDVDSFVVVGQDIPLSNFGTVTVRSRLHARQRPHSAYLAYIQIDLLPVKSRRLTATANHKLYTFPPPANVTPTPAEPAAIPSAESKPRLLKQIPNLVLGRIAQLVDCYVIFPHLSDCSLQIPAHEPESAATRAAAHADGALSPLELILWRGIWSNAVATVFGWSLDRIPSDFEAGRLRLAMGARVAYNHSCSSWQLRDIIDLISAKFRTPSDATSALGGQCLFVINGRGLKNNTATWRHPDHTTDEDNETEGVTTPPGDTLSDLLQSFPQIDFEKISSEKEHYDTTWDVAAEFALRESYTKGHPQTVGWLCDALQVTNIGLGGDFRKLQDCAAPVFSTANFGGIQGSTSQFITERSGLLYVCWYGSYRNAFSSYIHHNSVTKSMLSVRT